MSNHLDKYVKYIKNTDHVPLKTAWFIEDWSPIGSQVLVKMVKAGLIEIQDEGIYLKETTT